MNGPDPPKAVLDTNLLVRLLITPHGITAEFLNALTERAYHLVTSEPLFDELAEVVRPGDFLRLLKR